MGNVEPLGTLHLTSFAVAARKKLAWIKKDRKKLPKPRKGVLSDEQINPEQATSLLADGTLPSPGPEPVAPTASASDDSQGQAVSDLPGDSTAGPGQSAADPVFAGAPSWFQAFMQQGFVPWPSGQASLQADAFSVAASDSVSVYGHRHREHQISDEEEDEELIQVPHGKQNLKKKGALLDLTTELLGDDETVKPKVEVDPKVGKLLTKYLSSTRPLETIRSLAQDYPGIESVPKAVVPSLEPELEQALDAGPKKIDSLLVNTQKFSSTGGFGSFSSNDFAYN